MPNGSSQEGSSSTSSARISSGTSSRSPSQETRSCEARLGDQPVQARHVGLVVEARRRARRTWPSRSAADARRRPRSHSTRSAWIAVSWPFHGLSCATTPITSRRVPARPSRARAAVRSIRAGSKRVEVDGVVHDLHAGASALRAQHRLRRCSGSWRPRRRGRGDQAHRRGRERTRRQAVADVDDRRPPARCGRGRARSPRGSSWRASGRRGARRAARRTGARRGAISASARGVCTRVQAQAAGRAVIEVTGIPSSRRRLCKRPGRRRQARLDTRWQCPEQAQQRALRSADERRVVDVENPHTPLPAGASSAVAPRAHASAAASSRVLLITLTSC